MPKKKKKKKLHNIITREMVNHVEKQKKSEQRVKGINL